MESLGMVKSSTKKTISFKTKVNYQNSAFF
jgi:hypothetical protein